MLCILLGAQAVSVTRTRFDNRQLQVQLESLLQCPASNRFVRMRAACFCCLLLLPVAAAWCCCLVLPPAAAGTAVTRWLTGGCTGSQTTGTAWHPGTTRSMQQAAAAATPAATAAARIPQLQWPRLLLRRAPAAAEPELVIVQLFAENSPGFGGWGPAHLLATAFSLVSGVGCCCVVFCTVLSDSFHLGSA